jgi:hypothetical protein
MLDLVSFFKSIGTEQYCIIKISSRFPEYSAGEDIDIFCYDYDHISRKVLEWGNQYVQDGLDIKVQSQAAFNHASIDFMDGKKIHFRFDIYGQLPVYKKVLIKPALFESIIEHSKTVSYQYGEKAFTVKVPHHIDDSILRYIEFIEWYNVRPDKIKHLDYIMECIDEDIKIQFLTKLHHYTALPGHPDTSTVQQGPFRRILQRFYSRYNKNLPDKP